MSTRRDFIKKNALGGLFCATGLPFLGLANILQSKKVSLKLLSNIGEYNEIDWDEVRKQFLLDNDRCYMNAASLGPSPQIVIEQMCEMYKDLETRCDERPPLVAAAHEKIAKFLNANSNEIAITRNTTEGMNIVARSLDLKAGDEILLTNHEHIGGAAPWIALQKDIGVQIKLVNLDLSGRDNLQIIKDSLSEKTKVVSFSHLTCTTGMLLPAKEIVALCRSKGIYSCVDGAQSVGMIPVDLADMNPDFYACSGHKWLLGPKGTGILFINESVIEKCTPVFVGSHSDEKYDLDSLVLEYRNTAQREEYGTRNTPMVVGLSSAIDFISDIGIENVAKRGRELTTHFYDGLSQIPEVEILSPTEVEYFASIATIRIKDKVNASIPQKLFDKGKENNGKYIRTRYIYENNLKGIRISFAICNSINDVDYLLDSLKEIVKE